MNSTLAGQYHNKKVFVTGHTGFKGAWLTLWLKHLGCQVCGYSLPPQTQPNLFDLLQIKDQITHIEGDIRDYAALKHAINQAEPDIIFHLAAQAIVLDSYRAPKENFDVNAGGTVNVLEAIRKTPSIKAAVMITTDKCYENRNWLWGYRENDPLGGHDPYSASKSMAELAISSYRASFFNASDGSTPQIASVRAGNIIGGGDFSPHRILPDTIKSLMEGMSVEIRNPASSRPWLYVLDALHGYLMLGAALLQKRPGFAESWNFGPHENCGITVQELVEKSIQLWGKGAWHSSAKPTTNFAEMALLRLNWDKAATKLEWAPAYRWEDALKETIRWYKLFSACTLQPHIATYADLYTFCCDQIDQLYRGGSHEIHQTAHSWGL